MNPPALIARPLDSFTNLESPESNINVESCETEPFNKNGLSSEEKLQSVNIDLLDSHITSAASSNIPCETSLVLQQGAHESIIDDIATQSQNSALADDHFNENIMSEVLVDPEIVPVTGNIISTRQTEAASSLINTSNISLAMVIPVDNRPNSTFDNEFVSLESLLDSTIQESPIIEQSTSDRSTDLIRPGNQQRFTASVMIQTETDVAAERQPSRPSFAPLQSAEAATQTVSSDHLRKNLKRLIHSKCGRLDSMAITSEAYEMFPEEDRDTLNHLVQQLVEEIREDAMYYIMCVKSLNIERNKDNCPPEDEVQVNLYFSR